jgi:nucleotide-binding universal stress UspA family protein
MAMYKKILLAVDGSPTSDQALAQIANFVTTDATVRIVYVAEDPLTTYPIINEDFTYIELLREVTLEDGKKLLAKAEASLRSQGYQVQTSLIDLRGMDVDIPGAIKAECEKWGADLTVLGTHGRRGVRRLMLGSVAEHFMRISEGPVLLVRSSDLTTTSARRTVATLQSVPPTETDHA